MVPNRGGSTSSHDEKVRYQAALSASTVPYFTRSHVAEPRQAVRAVAELCIRQVGGERPVHHRRLAPHIVTVQRAARRGVARHLLEEAEDRASHARVIEAEARRRLRRKRHAALRGEPAVREAPADPLGRRVHVDLDDDLQARLLGQLQHQVEVGQPVVALARLARAPLDPGAHGVEAERPDPLEIGAPLGLGCGSEGRDHRRAGVAAAVPDGHREERVRPRRRHGGEAGDDRAAEDRGRHACARGRSHLVHRPIIGPARQPGRTWCRAGDSLDRPRKRNTGSSPAV